MKRKCNEVHTATSKKTKVSRKLTKTNWENVAHSLEDIDLVVLTDEVTGELKLHFTERSLSELVTLLCCNDELLKQIVEYHRNMFIQLYLKNGKKKDPFLYFQIEWHQNCSALLLEEAYELTEIGFNQQSHSVDNVRNKWLEFCKSAEFPVPVSNPVMITLSSTVYNTLTEHLASKTEENDIPIVMSLDGDDVYYRFGGAALCDMLHQRYKQIKTSPKDRKDIISQEITILQAINSKDKSAIPDYMKYRDLGYMYFPHQTFIPFLRNVDTSLKEVVNPSGLEKHGHNLIKVF